VEKKHTHLRLKYLGIDTYKEPVIYMRKDCHICRSEGFESQSRVQVTLNHVSLIATLNIIESDLLHCEEASLSQFAWHFLSAKAGDYITISHPKPLISLSDIHSKIYGLELSADQLRRIVNDIVSGQLSAIHIATFITATAANHLNEKEIIDLTEAMIDTGERLTWPAPLIVDKHCVGGLPGNRTTLIVVPIVAAFGLMIPKTSSRAITSPAGTADTMEVLAPVELNLATMKRVVAKEGGCIVWGGSVTLSPADDLLIQIERAIDLDSTEQLVASVLSKKIAAGSTHIVLDMPIGPTVKVRSMTTANRLRHLFEVVSNQFGLTIKTVYSDASQPVGRGIGPALEAQDAVMVLQGDKRAPQDLRERALTLAGYIIEFSPTVPSGQGKRIAQTLLDNGTAWRKFQAICDAQGGMRDIPRAQFSHDVLSHVVGKVSHIDNRYIARIAKLAGAPHAKAAGVLLHVALGMHVEKNQPLFTVYAESSGELNYALTLLKNNLIIINVE